MSEEEFMKAITEIPKDENNKTISTYGSIDIDDLRDAVKRLNKIPDYNSLLKENKQLKEQLKVITESFQTALLDVSETTQELNQRDEVIEETLNKLQLLINIGFDYDGFNQIDSLKTLIDELVNYARESKAILSKYKGDNNENRNN